MAGLAVFRLSIITGLDFYTSGLNSKSSYLGHFKIVRFILPREKFRIRHGLSEGHQTKVFICSGQYRRSLEIGSRDFRAKVINFSKLFFEFLEAGVFQS